MRAFNSWHFILGENDIWRKYVLTISLAAPCQMFFAKKARADKYTFRGIEGNIITRSRPHHELVNRIRSVELTDVLEKRGKKSRKAASIGSYL